MYQLLALAVSILVGVPDKPVPSVLDRGIEQLTTGKLALKKFKLEFPASSIKNWMSVAADSQPNSRVRLESSFLSAIHGIDCKRCIRQLTDPFRLKASKTRSRTTLSTAEIENNGADYRPQELSLLLLNLLVKYGKCPETLRALLRLPADGADEEELVSILEREWKKNASRLLTNSYQSHTAILNLYNTLADLISTSPNRSAFKRASEAQLRCYARNGANAHLSAPARALLKELGRHPDVWTAIGNKRQPH